MDKEPKFLKLWQAIVTLVGLVFVQMFVGLLLLSFGYKPVWGDPHYTFIVTLISYGLCFVYLMKYLNTNIAIVFAPTGHSNSALSHIIVIGIPLILVSGGGVVWLSDLTRFMLTIVPPSEGELEAMATLLSGGFASFVVICIVAPFAEEFLFRGIILRSFLAHYSVIASILLSALLFALYHMTIVQLPTAFLLGCLYGWLYVRTRSLWPCVLGHFIHNFLAFIISVNSEPLNTNRSTYEPSYYSNEILLLSLFASGLGGLMLYKVLHRPSSP